MLPRTRLQHNQNWWLYTSGRKPSILNESPAELSRIAASPRTKCQTSTINKIERSPSAALELFQSEIHAAGIEISHLIDAGTRLTPTGIGCLIDVHGNLMQESCCLGLAPRPHLTFRGRPLRFRARD